MFKKIIHTIGHGAGALGLVVLANTAMAADYPKDPIRLVVSTAAGGGGDTVARLYANRLSEELKQPVIVENKPGASGVIAATNVLRAPHDGYTLLFGITTFTQLPSIQNEIPFDPKADFIPVSLVATSSSVLLVNSNTGINTVKELADAIAANPKDFNFGSWGNGSTGHFMGELFNLKAKVQALHVPYKGAAPMISDLLAGVIPYAFSDGGSARAQAQSDRVRALAVTGSTRSDIFPGVPTMEEEGYTGFDFGGWFGVLAPRGTPADVVAVLEKASTKVGSDPAIQQRLQELSLNPAGSDGKEFAAFLEKDLATWREIAEEAGIEKN